MNKDFDFGMNEVGREVSKDPCNCIVCRDRRNEASAGYAPGSPVPTENRVYDEAIIEGAIITPETEKLADIEETIAYARGYADGMTHIADLLEMVIQA